MAQIIRPGAAAAGPNVAGALDAGLRYGMRQGRGRGGGSAANQRANNQDRRSQESHEQNMARNEALGGYQKRQAEMQQEEYAYNVERREFKEESRDLAFRTQAFAAEEAERASVAAQESDARELEEYEYNLSLRPQAQAMHDALVQENAAESKRKEDDHKLKQQSGNIALSLQQIEFDDLSKTRQADKGRNIRIIASFNRVADYRLGAHVDRAYSGTRADVAEAEGAPGNWILAKLAAESVTNFQQLVSRESNKLSGAAMLARFNELGLDPEVLGEAGLEAYKRVSDAAGEGNEGVTIQGSNGAGAPGSDGVPRGTKRPSSVNPQDLAELDRSITAERAKIDDVGQGAAWAKWSEKASAEFQEELGRRESGSSDLDPSSRKMTDYDKAFLEKLKAFNESRSPGSGDSAMKTHRLSEELLESLDRARQVGMDEVQTKQHNTLAAFEAAGASASAAVGIANLDMQGSDSPLGRAQSTLWKLTSGGRGREMMPDWKESGGDKDHKGEGPDTEITAGSLVFGENGLIPAMHRYEAENDLQGQPDAKIWLAMESDYNVLRAAETAILENADAEADLAHGARDSYGLTVEENIALNTNYVGREDLYGSEPNPFLGSPWFERVFSSDDPIVFKPSPGKIWWGKIWRDIDSPLSHNERDSDTRRSDMALFDEIGDRTFRELLTEDEDVARLVIARLRPDLVDSKVTPLAAGSAEANQGMVAHSPSDPGTLTRAEVAARTGQIRAEGDSEILDQQFGRTSADEGVAGEESLRKSSPAELRAIRREERLIEQRANSKRYKDVNQRKWDKFRSRDKDTGDVRGGN